MTILKSLPAVVLLHGDPSLLTGPFWTTWSLDASVALGVFALVAGYIFLTAPGRRTTEQPVSTGQRAAFLAGCLGLLIALGPPLEDWAGLLLAGHMTQHILLTMMAPPLLLLGTPAWLLRPLLRWSLVNRIGYLLTRPLVALVLPAAVFILWHMPALYDAALRFEPLHIVQHQMYIATAFLAWWPLVGPLPEWPRPATLAQCLYLFAQTLPGGLVGSFLSLAQTGLYPYYRDLPRMWGVSLGMDQQIAGLMMWVGASTVYLVLTAVVFFRWAAREEAKERGQTWSSTRSSEPRQDSS
ncbi:MAG: cytochrome c oxidase assembly protein [Chloroflexia bacterium]|nr:cytochrome c oxidase assembly protein [Chloroflexia bacterium]